jgi:4-hydroxybenzoyl-CoA thioesterase
VLKNTIDLRINWGDFDPAAVSFYPNYFRWFDEGTWRLFEAAGHYPGDLIRDHGVYLPLVDARARFKRPGHMGDDLVQESFVAEWHDRMFLVKHVVRRDGEVLLEGSELRAWAVKHPDDPRRFQTLPIPADVRSALGEGEA